jgi:hypothetical protein
VKSEHAKSAKEVAQEKVNNGEELIDLKPLRAELLSMLAEVVDVSRIYYCDSKGKILKHMGNKVLSQEINFQSDVNAVMKASRSLEEAVHEVSGNNSYFREYWRGVTKNRVHTIENLAFKSDDVFCWHRLPFDLMPWDNSFEDKMPLFEGFLKRCSDPEVFAMFIASLFDKKADKQQYMWVHGEGNDGKSSIFKALFKIMGQACSFQNASTKTDKFWEGTLIDKTVVIYDDCNNPALTLSGIFKTLTGGGNIRVERKGDPNITSGTFEGKVIIGGNYAPAVEDKRADRRRLLYVKVDTTNDDPKFSIEALIDEFPYFLSYCNDLYERKRTHKRSIPPQCVNLEELISDNEAEKQAFFDEYFVADENREIAHSDFFRIVKREYHSRIDLANFREFVHRKYAPKTVKPHGKARVFKGIGLKSYVNHTF